MRVWGEIVRSLYQSETPLARDYLPIYSYPGRLALKDTAKRCYSGVTLLVDGIVIDDSEMLFLSQDQLMEDVFYSKVLL